MTVRQGNRMGQRSVKRCDELDDNMEGLVLVYLKPTVALASKSGVRMAVFSNCCFGGRQQKWRQS